MLPASARPGHLRAMLVTLDRLTLGQQTNVSKPLHQLADSLTKRGMVVLISDLLDDPERVIRGLKHFQFRGTDVIVFHVLDPDEIEFPFERATRFEDLETDDEVMAVPAVVRAALSRGDAGLDRALQARARRRRHRLPPARHVGSRSSSRCWRICRRGRARRMCMMSFLSPLFLLGALAAAMPIVLHLLKREPEARVKFSAVQLLRHAPVEHTSRRRLRELLLLALRVAALLLLALAFARPFLASGRPPAGRRDGGRARHVAEHVGARAVRARAANWRSRPSPARRRRSGRRRHLRRRRAASRASRPAIARWPSPRSTARSRASARRATARRSTPRVRCCFDGTAAARSSS